MPFFDTCYDSARNALRGGGPARNRIGEVADL